MRPADHTRTDRLLIARVSGLARHRDTDHPDRWPDLAARMRAVTTDPHLLAHAAVAVLDSYAQVLALAGADLDEAYALREAPVQGAGSRAWPTGHTAG